jgi:hypothetical protein
VKGRIDHMAIPCGGALQVAALGNGTVELLDTRDGKVLNTIKDLPEPQGVVYARIMNINDTAVSCGGDGTVRFFSDVPGGERFRVDVGDDADNLRWDSAVEQVVVGHGDGALSWIDPKSREITATVKLEGHPESFQLESRGKRVFVNVPGACLVAVVDREQRKVVARWETGEAKANYPMALDEERKRLFVGCRKPARLLVLDTDSGKILQSLECVGDADDVFVDAATGRVLVIGGEGFVDVFSRDAAGAYSRTSRTPTAPGARTGLLEGDRLFVASPAKEGKEAAVLVYRLLPPAPK